MATFPEKLKEARKSKSLKQSEVAAQMGCAATSITNWETGKVQPSMDVLSRICDIYEVDPASLLDREYSYEDLVAIAGKPVPERSYEEQVALNFSHTILNRLTDAELQRQETERNTATAQFLTETDIMSRFGMLGRGDIQKLQAEYDYFKEYENDLLFAFHAISGAEQGVVLNLLEFMVSNQCNLDSFIGDTEAIENAKQYTLQRLEEAGKAALSWNAKQCGIESK